MANIEYLIGFLVMGGLIGWLAGFILKSRPFGILGDVVVGVVGAFVGGALFRVVGQETYNPLGGFVTALVGALILVSLIRIIRRHA